jgi:hypothetical protein
VKDEVIGRSVKCPVCKEPFTAHAERVTAPATGYVPDPKPTFWVKLLEGSGTMLWGLGILAAGVLLNVVVMGATGRVSTVTLAVPALGFAVFLYGLAGGSLSPDDF